MHELFSNFQVTTVVFDKTGTVTQGKPQMTKITCLVSQRCMSLQRLMAIVGSAESSSEHPIARAITSFAKHVCSFAA
jgi:Cu+-exporting ATPase